MKKLALIALTLISANVFANNSFIFQGEPFAGAYGGLDLGYRSTGVKDNQSSTIFAPEAFNIELKSSPEAFNNNLGGGFNVGYGVTYHNFFMGAEGKAIFVSSNVNSMNQTLTETNSQLMIVDNVNVTLKNELSFLLKLGYLVGQKTLFYGLTGPQWGYFKANTNTSYMQNLGVAAVATTQNSSSHYDAGFLLGAGIEHLVTDRLSVALEFSHVNYQKINYPMTAASNIIIGGVPFPGSRLTEIHSLSAQTNNALIKINYYFF